MTSIRSRLAKKRAKMRKKKILRKKVHIHNRRRYSGVRVGLSAGARAKSLATRRTNRLVRHKVSQLGRHRAKAKTKKRPMPVTGAGMAPLSTSSYFSLVQF